MTPTTNRKEPAMAAQTFTDEVSSTLDEHGVDHVRDTKVTFTTNLGSAETTIGGIEDAASMLRTGHEQLTFDVGARYKRPDEASLTLTGAGTMIRELYLGDTVTVRVTNARGEIVSEATGSVVDLAFKEHPEKQDKDGSVTAEAYVERKHKIKLAVDE